MRTGASRATASVGLPGSTVPFWTRPSARRERVMTTTSTLFAYGTLAPDGPEEAARGGWAPDMVRGRLFDLGPYPALVDCDHPSAGWVAGYVCEVDADLLVGRLDDYEGVGEGLYRRILTTTRGGRRAWVYVYARPLPPDARGPLDRWDGPRAGTGRRAWDPPRPDPKGDDAWP
jgi:gamma-glutamylcyclotransferase (GGCT)/AIG2-like uncharacterized protein YtfP